MAPKKYHPAFFGCFDWHSRVHVHWMLARLIKLSQNIGVSPEIHNLFNKHFTAENIKQEMLIFKSKDNKSFEGTDGKLVHLDGLNLSRAWYLKGIALLSKANTCLN